MKLVGILSAYDESPHWLAVCVAGFARVCDAIVYADGAYALYPGARPRSNPEQAEAVLQACEALGVECLIHRPSDVYWGNEVEKRNTTLRLAGALDPDWLLIFDGDYHVMRCEPDTVRSELERTDRNVATYTLLAGKDLLAQDGLAQHAAHVDVSTEWTIRVRHIYRWTNDLSYGPAHYTISGTYDGEEQWICGPELIPLEQRQRQIVPALDLDAALVAVHRREDRAKVRRVAAEGYFRNRDRAGIERLDMAAADVAA